MVSLLRTRSPGIRGLDEDCWPCPLPFTWAFLLDFAIVEACFESPAAVADIAIDTEGSSEGGERRQARREVLLMLLPSMAVYMSRKEREVLPAR